MRRPHTCTLYFANDRGLIIISFAQNLTVGRARPPPPVLAQQNRKLALLSSRKNKKKKPSQSVGLAPRGGALSLYYPLYSRASGSGSHEPERASTHTVFRAFSVRCITRPHPSSVTATRADANQNPISTCSKLVSKYMKMVCRRCVCVWGRTIKWNAEEGPGPGEVRARLIFRRCL